MTPDSIASFLQAFFDTAFIFCAGIPFLALLLLLLLLRFRIDHPACPACVHDVKGLAVPRCPECGTDLAPGVLRKGATRPRPRAMVGNIVVLLALLFGLLSLVNINLYWTTVLRAIGVHYTYNEKEFEGRVPMAGFDGALEFELEYTAAESALFKEKVHEVGRAEFRLIEGTDVVASWSGSGQVVHEKGVDGLLLDLSELMASLHAQIEHSDGSSFNAILDNAHDARQLEQAIASFAGPSQTRSSHGWPKQDGSELFSGAISVSVSSSSGNARGLWIWWVPPYLFIGVLFAVMLVIGLRLASRRQHLMPFASVGGSSR